MLPTPDPVVADLVARWAESGRTDPAGTVAAVVAAVAAARGVNVELRLDDPVVPATIDVDAGVSSALEGPWGPWLPGFVREALTSDGERRDAGVHHTPPRVVDQVLDRALIHAEPLDEQTTVLDPAVGGGAFLLAMAERMPGTPFDIVARLHGVDVDPLAVATTRAALSLWAGGDVALDTVRVGDHLVDDPFATERFDLVVGNPPFLSQLRGGTPRSQAQRAALAERWAGVGGYVDDAAAFLLAGVDALADGGTVVLVQPASVLGAVDARSVRERLARSAPPRALWVDPGRAFAAGVDTVALVCRGGDAPPTVDVDGVAVDRPSAASWAPLLAAAAGVPVVPRPTGGATLGDVARVTAGFRDQYYGLTDAVVDDAAGAHPLVTSGVIDPLDDGWGRRPTRFAKRSFDAPAVLLDRVDPSIDTWIRDRLVPKVLVASQTRLIEAIVDVDGRCVPCTPVVSVEPVGGPSIWHLAALLISPVATAWLVTEAAGTALSAAAVRVSAATLAALPLPDDEQAWDIAAEAARNGDVAACGRAMLQAHAVDGDALYAWWWDRMPTR